MTDFDDNQNPNDSIDNPSTVRKSRHRDWTDDAVGACTIMDLRAKFPDDADAFWHHPPSAYKFKARAVFKGTGFRLDNLIIDYDTAVEDARDLVGYIPRDAKVELQLIRVSDSGGGTSSLKQVTLKGDDDNSADFPVREWIVAEESSKPKVVRQHLKWRKDNDGLFFWEEDGECHEEPEGGWNDGDPRAQAANARGREDGRGYEGRAPREYDPRGPAPQQGYQGQGYAQPQGQYPAQGGYATQPGYPPPPPPMIGTPVPGVPNAIYGPPIPPAVGLSVRANGHYLHGNQWVPVPPGYELPAAPPAVPAAPVPSAIGLQPNGDRIFPSGLILHPDGSRTLPDGNIVDTLGRKMRPDGTPIEEPKAPAPPPPAMDTATLITTITGAIATAVTAAAPLLRPAQPPAPDGAVEAARVNAESALKLRMLEIEQSRLDAAEKARQDAEVARIAREEAREKDRIAREDQDRKDRLAREAAEAAVRREDKKERDEAAWRAQMFAAGFIVGPDGSLQPLKPPRDDKDNAALVALLREQMQRTERKPEKTEDDFDRLLRLKTVLDKFTGGGNDNGGGSQSTTEAAVQIVSTLAEKFAEPIGSFADGFKAKAATARVDKDNEAVHALERVRVAEAEAAKANALAAQAQAQAAEANARAAMAQAQWQHQPQQPQAPYGQPQWAPQTAQPQYPQMAAPAPVQHLPAPPPMPQMVQPPPPAPPAEYTYPAPEPEPAYVPPPTDWQPPPEAQEFAPVDTAPHYDGDDVTREYEGQEGDGNEGPDDEEEEGDEPPQDEAPPEPVAPVAAAEPQPEAPAPVEAPPTVPVVAPRRTMMLPPREDFDPATPTPTDGG